MSHFGVMVITDGTKTVDELLAPYQENCNGDVPQEYLEFIDEEDGYHERWENESATMIRMDHRLYLPWDDVFRKPGEIGYSSNSHVVPEGAPRIDVPFKVLYPDFEDYMSDWCGMERDEKTGRYGFWQNPNARWDWYKIGGRQSLFAFKALGCAESKVSYNFFGEREVEPLPISVRDALEHFDGVRQSFVDECLHDYDNEDSLVKYFMSHDNSRERYEEMCRHIHSWAVITPDGAWHEWSKMGWFGMNDAGDDESELYYDWCVNFEDRFLTNPDDMITMVDCHI